ncbi:cell division protein FtsL [Ideonella sp. B7]|uniref:cell division protein FtsL n=1 Tax=Ideonella benzenivorans TaxID=2831643 RepID=UPI001CEC10C6|nr:cell division protein FtsL [Ideonella benzenivorans]MCA6217006.1 cell division protein FtsL [Ideonella benzenivorans]
MNRLSLVLLIALVGSAMYLVKTSYEARRAFADLEKAKAEERQLATDAVRLEAERRSEGTHLRVERDAREKLAMRLATPDVTLYVNDSRGPAASSVAPGGTP